MGFLLSLLKFAKLAPILKSAAFMLMSVGAYALLYGWQFAVGFVLLILVHELGHYVAARRQGMDVGLPTFIPFVGAWIELKDVPLSVEQEAHIAFAGPLAGTLGASQQNVSKHLGVLHGAGIVERRKDGTRVVYGIADPTVFALCEIVCDGLARHLAEMTVLLDQPGGVAEALAAGR